MFSGLSALVIEDVADDGEMIRVLARTRDAPFPCPMCGVPTGKVHGYHVRTVADVPVDGRRVVVNVRVRRLVCPVLGCRRQTFREQVPGLIERLQRRTTRLTSQVSGVVKELCGRAAARLTGEFAAFLTPAQGNDDKLTQWIAAVRTAGLPHLHSFCNGLKLDRAAVNAGLTLPHHNGRTEGVNTRTKKIMRQMHGRAGFDLLRHRILLQ
ncbi:transposase family protein [Streptomyces europaeiscabiei]|uniref:transposase family protein n=1 Tax=Streptomyces europaeiscabiei TaxID=146819 RepID=UPI0029B81E4C|nr:transposase family protein [Streptomyces europaeiscabiei]MDX3693766.1 transposase family protein [Streptomyces europaeiscabiei]